MSVAFGTLARLFPGRITGGKDHDGGTSYTDNRREFHPGEPGIIATAFSLLAVFHRFCRAEPVSVRVHPLVPDGGYSQETGSEDRRGAVLQVRFFFVTRIIRELVAGFFERKFSDPVLHQLYPVSFLRVV